MAQVIDFASPDKVRSVQQLMGSLADVLEAASDLSGEEQATALMLVTAQVAVRAGVPRKKFVAVMRRFLFEAKAKIG